MQQYNYAEEIIKDNLNQFVNETIIETDFLDDYVANELNGQAVINGKVNNTEAKKKSNAFREGIKNDEINIEEKPDKK